MTHDVVALVQAEPDARAIAASMAAAGPDLHVRHAAEGAILQLCGPGGRPRVSIEVPVHLRVPGEVERLLGTAVSRHVPLPAWWLEVRSAGRPDAAAVAGRFADEMARRLGGRVWRGGPADIGLAPADPPGADPTGSDGAQAASHPAIDLFTDRAAVVVQDRPLVPFTAWLADALRLCAETERDLQIVTPPGARLTVPMRLALAQRGGRWVVRGGGPGAPYDGLTGAELFWDGSAFAVIKDRDGQGIVAGAFKDVPVPVGEQLICTLQARHPADGGTMLGGAVQLLCEALSGAPPDGWGTAEPAGLPWHPGELTSLCRRRAPRPTSLVAVGGGFARPAIGIMLVSRTPAGVTESATVVVDDQERDAQEWQDGPRSSGLAETAARLVTEAAVESFYVQRGVGGRDLAAVPHWTGLPGPVGLALGPRSVREVGLSHAMSPPDVPARRIDGNGDPAVWYDLGDGISPESGARMLRLTRHLGSTAPDA